MADPEEDASHARPGTGAPPVPLFRPQAMGEPDYGAALAFAAPRWRALGWLALGGLAAIGPFLFADFDRLAHVRGIVAPAQGLARLVAQQDGIVTAVQVRQGARARRGQPILRIGADGVLPGGTTAPVEALRSYRARQRLAAEEAAAEQQRASAERGDLREQLGQAVAGAARLRDRITLQGERIDNNERRLRSLERLRALGHVAEPALLAQEEAVLTLRQQLAELRQGESERRHLVPRLRFQLAQRKAEARRRALHSAALLADLERSAAEAQARAEVVLASPFDGTVASLRASVGQQVHRAEELAVVAPSGGDLQILLDVPTRAAGLLRAGQRVRIRYDAFPYQRFGLGRGEIAEVPSAVGVAADGQGRAYRVRVRLLDPPGRFRLRPDMTLSASIVLERRSLLDWLLAPLRETWRQRPGNTS